MDQTTRIRTEIRENTRRWFVDCRTGAGKTTMQAVNTEVKKTGNTALVHKFIHSYFCVRS